MDAIQIGDSIVVFQPTMEFRWAQWGFPRKPLTDYGQKLQQKWVASYNGIKHEQWRDIPRVDIESPNPPQFVAFDIS